MSALQMAGDAAVAIHSELLKRKEKWEVRKKILLSNFPAKNEKNHFYGLFLTFELFG
jgi:hypothetical protein